VESLFSQWQTYMLSTGGVEPIRPVGYY
jgi:hypothetical protein